jgi:endonuclease/exonuclease/phosphatase family metal-dependent hydrolase
LIKRFLVGSAAALMVAACAAPTVNLLNPVSPMFGGQFAAPIAADSAGDAAPIRVVSFNVKLADRIDPTIEVLRSGVLRDADIISLQEMDETGVQRIARALHLNYIYYPGSIHPTRHRYFGPAILTRWPIEDTRKLILPHEGLVRHQRRNATAATISVRGACVRVYAVHLETQLRASAHDREDQAGAILADAATIPCPTVVAGDFNSWGIGRYFEQQGYMWPTRRVGHTITIFSWDHIFARGFDRSGTTTAGQVREVHGASDHHPVWAALVLPARATPRLSASLTAAPSPR